MHFRLATESLILFTVPHGLDGANPAPDSFTSAWSKADFPPENRAFVERVTAEL